MLITLHTGLHIHASWQVGVCCLQLSSSKNMMWVDVAQNVLHFRLNLEASVCFINRKEVKYFISALNTYKGKIGHGGAVSRSEFDLLCNLVTSATTYLLRSADTVTGNVDDVS